MTIDPAPFGRTVISCRYEAPPNRAIVDGQPMTSITDPHLQVLSVPDEPMRRRLEVSYELHLETTDLVAGGTLVHRAVIRSRDLHDGLGRPVQLSIALEDRSTVAEAGTSQWLLTTEVDRDELDVQLDWWRSDHGGGVEPIAENPDHVVAEITVSIEGNILAEATTPLVSGSWGRLGPD